MLYIQSFTQLCTLYHMIHFRCFNTIYTTLYCAVHLSQFYFCSPKMSCLQLCMCHPTSVIPWSCLTTVYASFLFLHCVSYYSYSMVQSPSWAANWFAASQEIPSISRNPNVHYRTHKRPPPVPILGQPNPVHIPTSHLMEIHLILSTHLRLDLPSGLLPSGFPTKTLYTPSPHPYAPHAQPISFSILSPRTILGEQYKSFSSSLCNLLHSPVTSSLLGPNILLNTTFSNTLSFLSSSNVSDQVSYNTAFLFVLM